MLDEIQDMLSHPSAPHCPRATATRAQAAEEAGSANGGAPCPPPEMSRGTLELLLAQVDPDASMTDDLVAALQQEAAEFMRDAVRGACGICRHRKSDNLSLADVAMYLSRQRGLTLDPLYGGGHFTAHFTGATSSSGLDPCRLRRPRSPSGWESDSVAVAKRRASSKADE